MTHQKIHWTSIEREIRDKLVKKYGTHKGIATYYAMRENRKSHGNGMGRAAHAPGGTTDVAAVLARRAERLKKIPFESNMLKDVVNNEVKKLGGGE